MDTYKKKVVDQEKRYASLEETSRMQTEYLASQLAEQQTLNDQKVKAIGDVLKKSESQVIDLNS